MVEEKILDILLFLKEIEYSVEVKINGNEKKVIVWIPFYKIQEFNSLFPKNIFDDGGQDVKLQENCIALDIKEMLEYSIDYAGTDYVIRKLEEWQ